MLGVLILNSNDILLLQSDDNSFQKMTELINFVDDLAGKTIK